MKAGIYIRVSTLQQEDGTSLATQEEGCRLAAREEGYEVSSDCMWSDQWSGADIERPGLGQMRMAAKKGAVSAVFVFTPDRLARDPFHLLLLGEELRDVGVKLRFVRGPSDDSPEGRLLMYIQGYVGQQERALIAERTMMGKQAVAESGRLPNGTGAGLFGYDYNPLLKLRTINEREAAAVRLMFRRAAAAVSRYQIARRLNEANIPTKKGKPWYPLTVHRTLTNRAYTGVQYYGKRRYRRLKGGRREVTNRPESEWIRIEGFTPPIISEELFEMVQERLSVSQAQHTLLPRNRYLLTGFVRCAECGSPVVGSCLSRNLRYYRCRATVPTATGPATCHGRYIRADRLESLTWHMVVTVLEKPEVLFAELKHHLETGEGDLGEEMSRLRRDIADLKKQQRRLLEQRQKDFIDQEILESQIGPVKALCDEKERSLRVLEEQQKQKDDEDAAEARIKEFCDRLAAKLPGLDFDGKRAALAAFGVKVLATVTELSVTVVVDPNVTTIEQTLA